MDRKIIFNKAIFFFAFLILLLCFNNNAYAMVQDNKQDQEDLSLHRPVYAEEKQTPQYAPGEVLVKFKEGIDPQSVITEAQIAPKNIQRIHSIKPFTARFRKAYKINKDKAGSFSFLGRKYKDINAIPDDEVFKEAYKNAPETEKSLYRSYKINLPEGMTVEEAIAKLKNNPNVKYAEPNGIVKVQMVLDDPYYYSSNTWGQGYDDLWGIKKIQCGQAWDISQGKGVIVAVIDSGVDYNHPDLAANIWINSAEDINHNGKFDNWPSTEKQNGVTGDLDGKDNDKDGYVDDVIGWDFVGADIYDPIPDPDPMDILGHGTHVAGTIAAVGNNGIGVIGVAPKAKIMAVRGLDDYGYGDDANLSSCVKYAVDKGAKVLNNSWGEYGSSQTLTDIFHYAHNKGRVAVAAAGNSDDDASNYSPANIDTVIAVAASNQNDEKCDFSNYGEKIDVSAPGGDNDNDIDWGYNILSTMPDDSVRAAQIPELKVSDGYWRLAGTSMACPHVAGAAALILSKYPSLSNDSVRDRIRVYSDDIGYGGKDDYFGYGRLNVYEAVHMSPKICITMVNVLEAVGNNDGYIDPGETVKVIITLKAVGADFYGVEALINSDDEFIQIENGLTTFDKISKGKEVSNAADPFQIVVSRDCPRGYTVKLQLSITAGDYTFSTIIPIEIYSYWPFDPPHYAFWSSGAAADINGDGQIEIVTGAFGWPPMNIKLFCVNKKGKAMWEHKFNGAVYGPTPALCDFDGDGKSEIIFGVCYSFDTVLYCMNSEGQIIWEKFFSDTLIDDFSPPVIADINGDGKQEILFTYWYYYRTSGLLCLDGNGNELWSFYSNDWFPIPYQASGTDSVPSPAVADLEGDGNPEILFGTAIGYGWRGVFIPGGDLYCVNNTGQELWHTAVGCDYSIPTIADLNNDGIQEILIGVGLPEYPYGLCCLDKEGSMIWKYETSEKIDYSSPAVADLNGDGSLEIVVGCDDGGVYCIDKDGQLVWKYETGGAIWSSPAIADLNGDSKLEILFGSEDYSIYCIDKNGNLLWKRETECMSRFSPIIANLGGSRYPEIITGSDNLYCLDKDGNFFDPTKISAPLTDLCPWPMFQRNMQHTGYLDTIILDTTPPTGSINIDNGNAYTSSTSVMLSISAQDDPSGSGLYQMKFSNDNTTWSTPEAYATSKSWTLSSGDGTKTVYVKFSDVAGNWSTAYSDTIILDTIPPVVTINPVTSPTNINNQTVTGTKTQDTAEIIITAPTLTVGRVTYPTSTTWSCYLSSFTAGNNVINVTGRDLANNVSAGVSATINYIPPSLNWYPSVSNPSNQAVYCQGVSHSGSRSLKVVNTVVDYTYWYGDTINFSAPYPKTFALSGWAKGQKISSGSWIPMYYYVVFEDDSSNMYYIADLMFPTGSYNWRNRSITYTFNKGVKAIKPFLQLYGTGTVWFDDIGISTITNPLSNPNMEQGTTQPDNWNTYNNDLTNQTGWATDASYSPTHSLKIINTQHKNAGWYGSTVTFNQPYPKTVKFGGYSKSKNVSLRSGGLYCLDFYIKFEDNSILWYYPNGLRFSNGTHTWQKKEITTTFTKGIKEIRPYCLLYNGRGTVWFDDMYAIINSPNLVLNPGMEQSS